ncbi:hypothetical protein Tco_0389876 [Tanacetum coccineum]
MENENPIRTLGDYSRPSHEGYRNTIKLPDGNNVVPLRSDTIRSYVGIKRLHDDLGVTAAKVRVTAAKQNLVLLVNAAGV